MSYAKTFEPGEYLRAYKITEHLGRGAFKNVYRAVNTKAAENGYPAEVALCVSHTQDDEARALLDKESSIIRVLDHPGIPKVYALEETAECFFMVMELVEGEPLSALLKRSGRVSLDEAVRIIRQVGEPLDHAHECFAFHRDIKPDNIVLCPDGSVKLLDFGLSRLMAHSQYKTTSKVGTVSFMAPEQYNGEGCFNADIWSLAVTFYLILTGTFPFNADNEGQLVKQILYDPPCLDQIEQLGLSQRLVGIMRKALVKDPEKRYRHADEFVADLEAVLQHGQPASEVEGQIETLLRAHFPLIYLNTSEEGQALASLAHIRDNMAASGKDLGLYVWSETRGLLDRTNRSVAAQTGGDPLLALRHVVESRHEGIYVFLDIHRHLTPPVVRLIRDAMHAVKRDNKTLIFISPVITLPKDLESDTTLLFYDLPDEEKLRELTSLLIEEHGDIADGTLVEILARAVLGLTRTEAERVLRRGALRVGGFNRQCVAEVLGEKEQAVRKAGLLEFCKLSEGFSQVGGLEKLKEWFRKRRQAFTGEGSLYGLPMPRGVVLAGLPGCGKSLSAKALAGEWGVPLLRLDMGRIYGSLLGASEANLRKALHTAEAVSPCILWIDELEKAFGGGGGNDGGTAKRVFGTFLNWLEERTSPVFVTATANNISRLPPEFTRKGRFDEIFFVGLPKEEERGAIFLVHLYQRGRENEAFDLDRLVAASDGFSGAEIKEAIISGLYRAFEEGERALTTDDILTAIGATIPFSRTRKGDLLALQDWAAANARAAQ